MLPGRLSHHRPASGHSQALSILFQHHNISSHSSQELCFFSQPDSWSMGEKLSVGPQGKTPFIDALEAPQVECKNPGYNALPYD